MSSNLNKKYEENDQRKSWIISFFVHLLLLFIFFIPFLVKSIEKENSGILVAFGDPFAGQNDEIQESELSPTTASSAASSVTKDNTIYSEKVEDEAPVKAQTQKKDAPIKKEKEIIKPTVKTNADSKAKEDAEAKRKAEEQRKAEIEKAEREAAENQKKKFSDLLGKGKGSNNNSGNQGQSNGDPDGKALEGISKGSGVVGGGLAGRGVLFTPSISDNSQKTGRVALNVCVNNKGQVVQADFTQKGSTTSDSYLINIARQNALKYKFSSSEIDKQCGTLTIDFKVQ